MINAIRPLVGAAFMGAAWTTATLAQTPAAIPDQKLDAAAAAIEQVVSIRQNYAQKQAGAAPDEQKNLDMQSGLAVRKAVTDQGLSFAEYNTILETAQNDPAVRERLIQRMHINQ